MPFKSKAQQRYLYANKPKGVDLKEWSDSTDFKHLPDKVQKHAMTNWATEYFKTSSNLGMLAGGLLGSVAGGAIGHGLPSHTAVDTATHNADMSGLEAQHAHDRLHGAFDASIGLSQERIDDSSRLDANDPNFMDKYYAHERHFDPLQAKSQNDIDSAQADVASHDSVHGHDLDTVDAATGRFDTNVRNDTALGAGVGAVGGGILGSHLTRKKTAMTNPNWATDYFKMAATPAQMAPTQVFTKKTAPTQIIKKPATPPAANPATAPTQQYTKKMASALGALAGGLLGAGVGGYAGHGIGDMVGSHAGPAFEHAVHDNVMDRMHHEHPMTQYAPDALVEEMTTINGKPMGDALHAIGQNTHDLSTATGTGAGALVGGGLGAGIGNDMTKRQQPQWAAQYMNQPQH